MKRNLFVCLIVAVLIALSPITASAQVYSGELETTNGGSVAWSLNSYSGELIIDGTGYIKDYEFSPLDNYAPLVKSVSFSNEIMSVGANLFANMSVLANVNLPEELTKISSYAFKGCSSLASIDIPAKVSYIDYTAFYGCNKLESFSVNEDNQRFNSILGVLYNKDCSNLIRMPSMNATSEEYTPIESVTRISSGAFYGVKDIKRIILPTQIEYIGANAFLNSSITSVSIYNSNCVLVGDNIFNDNVIIGCFNNSSAMSYAKNHGLTYAMFRTDECYSHSYKSTLIMPKCDSQGYTLNVCEYCADSYKSDYVSKLGHIYSKATTKATTSSDGRIDTRCERCSNVKETTKIYKASIVKLSKTKFVYDGTKKKPRLIIKNSKGDIIPIENYTVSYPKNLTIVGNKQVNIIFKNKYKGTKTLSYKIVPKATSIKSLESKSKKKISIKVNKQLKQTTGYQIVVSRKSDFSSNKSTYSLSNKYSSKTVSVKYSKKRYYVRVRAYKVVDGKRYYSAWSKAKSIVVK